MREETLFERLDRTPIAYLTLLAYITMAFVADPENPLDPSGIALIEHGSAVGILIPIEPWRLLTNAYLHGGLMHLLFNSYFLFQIGPMLERELGSLRFGLIYVITAVAGATAAVVLGSGNLVGGSGALFGMLGCIVAMNMRRGRNLLDFLGNRGSRQILFLIGINLLLGWLIPQISNTAHIGGLVSGFVLTFCFLERHRTPTDTLTRVIQAGWIALFLGVILFVAVPVARGGIYQDLRHDCRLFPDDTIALLTRDGIPGDLSTRIVDYYGK